MLWSIFTFLALVLGAMLFSVSADQTSYMIRTGQKYLDEQAAKEGAHLLKSGMVVEFLKKSDNADARSPNVGDSCECTYEGTFKDGSRFDGGTTSFAPNQVRKTFPLRPLRGHGTLCSQFSYFHGF